MRRIHKQGVPVNDFQPFDLQVPEGAHIVLVGRQGIDGKMWYEFREGVPYLTRTFVVRPTGRPIEDGLAHRGSWQNGLYVWHLYEVLDKPNFKMHKEYV